MFNVSPTLLYQKFRNLNWNERFCHFDKSNLKHILHDADHRPSKPVVVVTIDDYL